MAKRNYTNTATEAALASGITASDATFTVTSFAGFPAAPFTVAIDRGTASEEVVLVTSVGGSALTGTRGFDGTTAKSHAAGAQVLHVTVAKDYEEAGAHVAAVSGVHGVIGALVGTSDTQTLSNKSLVAPTISAPTVTGAAVLASATLTGTLAVSGSSVLQALTATAGTFSGNVSAGGTLAVTGNSTLTGTLVVNGATLTAKATTLTTLNTSGAAVIGGTLNVNSAVGFSTTLGVVGLCQVGSLNVQGAGTINAQGTTPDSLVRKDYVDAAKPYFAAYPTVAQSVPDNSQVVVVWGTEMADTANAHAANATAFIAPQTGFYRVTFSVAFKPVLNGLRYALLRLDGVNVQGTADAQISGTSLQNTSCKGARRLFMTAGQALDVAAGVQSTGSAVSIQEGVGAFASIFEVTWDGN